MPPVRYDTRIHPGATFRAIVEVPWDISGSIAMLEVREARQPRAVVARLTSGMGPAITIDPASRQIVVTLNPEFTANMPPARYSYDLDLQTAGGEVNRILRGVVTVRRR